MINLFFIFFRDRIADVIVFLNGIEKETCCSLFGDIKTYCNTCIPIPIYPTRNGFGLGDEFTRYKPPITHTKKPKIYKSLHQESKSYKAAHARCFTLTIGPEPSAYYTIIL